MYKRQPLDNTATVEVATKTNTTVRKTSNKSTFKVLASPDKITVTKRVRSSDIDVTHGQPTFPFMITFARDEWTAGHPYTIYRMVTLQDAGDGWYTGSFTLSAWDDLNLGRGHSGTVTVSEIPVSRFRLESVTTDPGGSTSGGKATFTVGDRLESDLSATFTNKKVTDAYFSHNACATNAMKVKVIPQ